MGTFFKDLIYTCVGFTIFLMIIFSLEASAKDWKIHPALAEYITDLSTKCDVQITSGYRDKQHNKKVGGVKNSLHLRGWAVDFVSDCKEGAIAIMAMNRNFRLLIYPGSHFHVDLSGPSCAMKTKKGWRACR